MSEFDPIALAAIQTDEITVTISRELAEIMADVLARGCIAVPSITNEHEDEIDEIRDQLKHFAQTGVDPTRADICYCIQCGQIDEPIYHDPAVCAEAARGLVL